MPSPIPAPATESASPPSAAPARPTVAVIPAAGFGTRLRPLTDAIPKEMLPVGNRVALDRIVEELRASGITRIVFVLSPAKEVLIKNFFGGERDGVTFAYALQHEMRGLGDAVLQAEPFVEADSSFVVALGDAVFEEAYPGAITARLCDAFEKQMTTGGDALGLIVQKVPREKLSRYGIVQPTAGADLSSAAFSISGIIEKPEPGDAPSEYAAAARYVFSSGLFDLLRQTPPGKNGEIQMTDAMGLLLAREGTNGIAVPLQAGEVRHDLGGPDSYFRAFAAFALSDARYGAEFQGYLESCLVTNKERSE